MTANNRSTFRHPGRLTAVSAAVNKALTRWHRVDRIFSRQTPQRWGAKYDPSIHAVPGEAPPRATPIAFRSLRLGRTMHALSQAEVYFMGVALMNPAVWDVHEQAIIHPYTSEHPLASHPEHRNQPWPATRGTLEILRGFGQFSRHPKVWRLHELSGEREVRPQPWIGDIRLFLTDATGPYVVEWDVKDRTGAHGLPYAGDAESKHSERALAKAELRERAYRECMADLEIPIRRVAKDQVSETALKNMVRIVMRVQKPLNMPDSLVAEIEHALIEAAIKNDTPAMAVRRVVRGDRATIAALRVLDWAIWRRRLRVDFESDILADRPLIPAKSDPVELHADLFTR